jgi:heparan-alpha-glucosaminide N-acetyltransferase
MISVETDAIQCRPDSSRANQRHSADGPRADRLTSLDAYRGFVMLALMSGSLVVALGSHFPEQPLFYFFARQFTHVDWVGCAFWDLIMPSFMLLVGMSLPFSVASRIRHKQSPGRICLHVLRRSVLFILLGLLLSSKGYSQTRFNFTGLLTQFGLAYPWAFFLVGRGLGIQSLAVGLILVGYWLAFYLHPLPPVGFDFSSVGLPDRVLPLTGIMAHWNRGTNLAAAFDVWFVNLFPQVQPYQFDPFGNQTLNFVPSIATMTIGVIAGERLRSFTPKLERLRWLCLWGASLLGIGLVAGETLCPIVKSIWTPSWVMFSGGLALLMTAAFFWAIEIRGWSTLASPLTILGMNSLAAYLLSVLAAPWLEQTARVHFTASWTGQQVLVVIEIWLVCFWMYRRRIFLRV